MDGSLLRRFMCHAGGGLSTLLGVVVLAGAAYPVFRIYYFRMYFLIIVLGLLHGFLMWPAILSHVGPLPKPAPEEEEGGGGGEGGREKSGEESERFEVDSPVRGYENGNGSGGENGASRQRAENV